MLIYMDTLYMYVKSERNIELHVRARLSGLFELGGRLLKRATHAHHDTRTLSLLSISHAATCTVEYVVYTHDVVHV